MDSGVSRSDVIIDWIGRYCKVPEGRLVGQPIELLGFQKDFIRAVYDNPETTRRAILSIARKGGKTTLCAVLLLAHLCGPLYRRNSQLFSAAQSRDQAAILFSLAAKIVQMSPELHGLVTIRESAKQLYCEHFGTTYRALSADATTAYGLSPVFVLFDELGQVRGPRSPLYEALETATAAHDDPLSIIISTQAPTEADLLSVLIDDALEGHDPRVVVELHAAPEDDDPFSEETIRKANPALGAFQNAKEVLDMAESARRMPSREAEFRNLILNQRVETVSPFITRSVWQANGGELEGWGDVYGGLDLSETNDLTALVLCSPVRGILNVKSTFWLPEDGLAERARQDRVIYDVWAEKGFINTVPGKSVDYDFVARHIADLFETNNIKKIAFDRFNMRHLRPCLVRAGMSEAFIDAHFEDFGQGYVSMSPAVRNLETLLLNEKVRHANHPALSMCAANAVVKMDEAGNRKLDKKRALALDTPLPAPWGWTSMGSVKKGDTLFDENGRPCRVTDKSDVFNGRSCFSVNFSDGSKVIADADHLWTVHDAKKRFSRTETTEDLIGIGLRWGHQYRFQIPVAKPLELPDLDLPMDPYLLGAWLGDGSVGSACITSMDDEIVVEFENHFPVTCKGPSGRRDNKAKRYVMDGMSRPLWEMGVFGRKFIPDIYLRASVSQRLSLLQGLMDTDGHISPPREKNGARNGGFCTFVNTNSEIAAGAKELALSLGLKPVLKLSRKAKPPHKEVYKLTFSAYSDMPVFRLSRKLERMLPPPERQTRASHRQIVSIDQVPTTPVQCITVDSPSHLFLCGESMVPTHNSRGRIDGMQALTMAASMAADSMNVNRVFPVDLDSLTESLA